MGSSKFPPNSKFRDWTIVQDGQRRVIRRWVRLPDGTDKFERYPSVKYSHLVGKALDEFVIRLNGKDPEEERVRAVVAFKHAFLSVDFMERYRDDFLFQQVPSRKDAQTLYKYLNEYALNFFISKLGLKNPLEWHRSQPVWGKYLLNRTGDELDPALRIFPEGVHMSSKVLRYTVNELNRLMGYLHLQRPDEVPPLKFTPISKAAYKLHDAQRLLANGAHVSRYVKPEHWEKIYAELERLQPTWRFPLYLAHAYGLRRKEAMALLPQDVRKAHLSVERQWGPGGNPLPLKNRKPRKVPHWFNGASQAHAWTSGAIGGDPLPHPDTLSLWFTELCRSLDLPPYTPHDLRRTFITNAVRAGHPPEETRLAAGHSDIQTTYRYYVMDARELEDAPYVPDDEDAA